MKTQVAAMSGRRHDACASCGATSTNRKMRLAITVAIHKEEDTEFITLCEWCADRLHEDVRNAIEDAAFETGDDDETP